VDLTYKIGIDETELVQKLSQTKLMIEQTLQSATSNYAGGVKAGFMTPFEETMGSLGAQANLQATTRLSNVQNMTLGVAQLGAMAGEYTSLPFYQNLMFGTRPSGLPAEQQVGAMYSRLQQGPANFMNGESMRDMMRSAVEPFKGQLGFMPDFTAALGAAGQTGFVQAMHTPQDLFRGIQGIGEGVREAQAFGISGTTAGQMFSQLAQAGVNPADLSRSFQASISAGNAGVSDNQSLSAAATAARQRSTFQAFGSSLPGLQGSEAIDATRQVQYGFQAAASTFERISGHRLEYDTAQSNAVMGLALQQMTYSGQSELKGAQLFEDLRMVMPAQMARINKDDFIAGISDANASEAYRTAKAKAFASDIATFKQAISLPGIAGMAMGTVGSLIPGPIGNFMRSMVQPSYTPQDQGGLSLNKASSLPYIQAGMGAGGNDARAAKVNRESKGTVSSVMAAMAKGDFAGAENAAIKAAESNPELRDQLTGFIKDAEGRYQHLSREDQDNWVSSSGATMSKWAKEGGHDTFAEFIDKGVKALGNMGAAGKAIAESLTEKGPGILTAAHLTPADEEAVRRVRGGDSGARQQLLDADPGAFNKKDKLMGKRNDEKVAMFQAVYGLTQDAELVKDTARMNAELDRLGPGAVGIYNDLGAGIMANGKVGYSQKGSKISHALQDISGVATERQAANLDYDDMLARMLRNARDGGNKETVKYYEALNDKVHSGKETGREAALEASQHGGDVQKVASGVLSRAVGQQTASLNKGGSLEKTVAHLVTSIQDFAELIKHFGSVNR
jgi:hypothetical protein